VIDVSCFFRGFVELCRLDENGEPEELCIITSNVPYFLNRGYRLGNCKQLPCESSNTNMENRSIDEKQHEFRVYPNPASNQLTLELKDLSKLQSSHIAILDMTGRRLLSKSFNGKMNIDITDLKVGVYFIQLLSDEKILVQERFIKIN